MVQGSSIHGEEETNAFLPQPAARSDNKQQARGPRTHAHSSEFCEVQWKRCNCIARLSSGYKGQLAY